MKGEVCCQCSKPLGANSINALGKQWHSDCFTCAACRKTITTGKFMILADAPYHPECVPKAPAPPSGPSSTLCAGCNKAMAFGSPVITMFDKPWHPDCFTCGTCGLPIKEAEFKVEGPKAFHRNCRIGPAKICKGCSSPINEKKFVEALDGVWHLACFKCGVCGLVIDDGGYKVENGAPVHSACKEDVYEVTEVWVDKDGKATTPSTTSMRKGLDGPAITTADGSPAGSPKAKAKAKPGVSAKAPAAKLSAGPGSPSARPASAARVSPAGSPKSSPLGSPTGPGKAKPASPLHAPTTSSTRPASATLSSPKGSAKAAPKPKVSAH
eukprot:EG_transcript_16095